MRHPEAHHAHGHLCHLIGMRVIHECARPASDEFINKSFSYGDLLLIQAAHAIHAVGQTLAMPMHRGVLRQFVRHKQSHTITFDHFNRRSGALPVVAPHIDFEAGRHFAHNWFGHKMKLFDSIIHAPRQRPAVQRDDGVVRPAGLGNERRHGVRLGLQHRLGQRGHGHFTDAGCSGS